MQTIKDLSGAEWQIHMKLRHARVIESRLGIDILSPDDAEQSILKLLSSPLAMFDFLWVMCEDQAKDRGVTREQFEDTFDGATYLEAEKSLNDEIVFFIQQIAPTQARLWIALLRKSRRVSEINVAKWEQFLDSPEMDTMIESEIDNVLNEAICSLRDQVGKGSGS